MGEWIYEQTSFDLTVPDGCSRNADRIRDEGSRSGKATTGSQEPRSENRSRPEQTSGTAAAPIMEWGLYIRGNRRPRLVNGAAPEAQQPAWIAIPLQGHGLLI